MNRSHPPGMLLTHKHLEELLRYTLKCHLLQEGFLNIALHLCWDVCQVLDCEHIKEAGRAHLFP